LGRDLEKQRKRAKNETMGTRRNDMLESIDIRSSVAAYVQIENQIEFAIAAGDLKAGDKLPSVRVLSNRIELNPNTVAKAYRDLEVKGLVWTRQGMGVFISKGVEAKCREICRKKIIEHLHEVTTEARAAGMTNAEVRNAVNASYRSDAPLYGPTPTSVLALAKKKKG
jgi:GntR family transcriptional regulator